MHKGQTLHKCSAEIHNYLRNVNVSCHHCRTQEHVNNARMSPLLFHCSIRTRRNDRGIPLLSRLNATPQRKLTSSLWADTLYKYIFSCKDILYPTPRLKHPI